MEPPPAAESLIQARDLPIFIMAVDTTNTGDPRFLQRVEEGIVAAMEGMPKDSLFGLMTFDHRVGIWSLLQLGEPDQGHETVPHVHYIPVRNNEMGEASVPLKRLVTLDRFLVPVRSCRMGELSLIQQYSWKITSLSLQAQ